ncbi:hypothetical protein GX865_04340, partial [Candidatus Saccharibacteria bacterium]|nr:hypothetical protein [Candidatus Saccharibacteria bacterium]
MRKYKHIGVLALLVAPFIFNLLLSGSAFADWRSDDRIDWRDNSNSANHRLDYICRDGAAAAHAGWLGSGEVAPDENGNFSMELYIKYKRCNHKYAPIKFAVIGYPASDTDRVVGLNFCDNVGTFGNHTYMGKIRQGESPGPRGQPFIGDYTYDCVKYMGGENRHLIRFNSARYGRTPGFDMYNELGWGVRGPVKRYIKGKIKNWSERKKGSGVETIDLPSRLCHFYMLGPNNTPYHSKYCQRVKFDVKWNGEFNLVPQISTGTGNITDGGDERVTGITAKVTNEGPGDYSEISRSGVSRFVVRKADRNKIIEGRSVDSRLKSRGDSVKTTNSVSAAAREYIERWFLGGDYRSLANPRPREFKKGTVTIVKGATDSLEGVSLEVGDRICYLTTVQNPTHKHNQSHWRHSVPACVAIAARPHVQVRSGDIMVGGKIISGTTSRQTDDGKRTYGSWGEYG